MRPTQIRDLAMGAVCRVDKTTEVVLVPLLKKPKAVIPDTIEVFLAVIGA